MAEIKEVFISYHEKSAGEYVAKLADRLEGAGISCWYAKRDLPSGGDFADYIPPQIYGCKVFLLILNEGVNYSRHVENEVGLAFRRYNKGEKITILPYQVEKCDFAHWLDYYLIHIQIQSAETMDDSALVTEVAHKIGREPAKNGHCGPSVRWTLKDGVLTISHILSGDGKMGDFYYQNIPECINTPWWSEREKITSLLIKNGITYIGSSSFRYCTGLSSITIPPSVFNIGNRAFYGCTGLKTISILHGLTSIGNRVFEKCTGLINVTIPESVTAIGLFAFGGCSALADIILPDNITIIEPFAFAGCASLKSVSIPANARIGYDAFDPHTEVIRRPA